MDIKIEAILVKILLPNTSEITEIFVHNSKVICVNEKHLQQQLIAQRSVEKSLCNTGTKTNYFNIRNTNLITMSFKQSLILYPKHATYNITYYLRQENITYSVQFQLVPETKANKTGTKITHKTSVIRSIRIYTMKIVQIESKPQACEYQIYIKRMRMPRSQNPMENLRKLYDNFTRGTGGERLLHQGAQQPCQMSERGLTIQPQKDTQNAIKYTPCTKKRSSTEKRKDKRGDKKHNEFPLIEANGKDCLSILKKSKRKKIHREQEKQGKFIYCIYLTHFYLHASFNLGAKTTQLCFRVSCQLSNL
eukprot:TRINITY_DN2441_c0_g1_i2.p1 TRINITY_DN2441_c0_g1~~TRINITY_DN2441_c0_g1_i2.p1  ORF type:complete len:306 (-),score=-11.97 TRINITY_DN2441_c0_g1_i2:224-1141(-)